MDDTHSGSAAISALSFERGMTLEEGIDKRVFTEQSSGCLTDICVIPIIKRFA
jgi:hypothetical protein